MPGVIVLITDFGSSDVYVGVMKGVMASIAPSAPVIDLAHEIPPQDVAGAAFALAAAYRYFPAGSIFCCVVDPGVGSERRAVAVRFGNGQSAVAPDNGLLTPLLRAEGVAAAVALDRPRFWLPEPSATFHGRDLFAPVAAHLASGVALDELGSPLAPGSLQLLPESGPLRVDDGWQARVRHVDRFGNLVTDLGAGLLAGSRAWRVFVAGRDVGPLRRTFAEVRIGEPLAYLGSSGLLEVAVRDGSAERELGVGLGGSVRVVGPGDGEGRGG